MSARSANTLALALVVIAAGIVLWIALAEGDADASGEAVRASGEAERPPEIGVLPEAAGPPKDPVAEVGGRREVEASTEGEAGVAPGGVPAANTAELRVTCVAIETGRPLAGVLVEAYPHPVPKNWLYEGVEGNRGDLSHAPRTGEDGRAWLDLAAGAVYRLNAYGVDVDASLVETIVEPLAPGERREILLEHRTAVDLTFFGRVLDKESGTPIARAEVTPRRPVELRDARQRALVVAEATSDEEGIFELRLPSWIRTDVRVRAEGWGPVLVHPSAGFELRARAMRIELDRAASVRGRVLAPGGRALADVRVALSSSPYFLQRPRGRATSHAWGAYPEWWAVTDAAGAFSIAGIAPHAVLDLELSREGTVLRSRPEEILLLPGEERDVEWFVGGQATITGVARDQEGKAVSDLPVWRMPAGRRETHVFATREHDRLVGQTTTDEHGRYVMDDVEPGRYWIGPGATRGVVDHDFTPLAIAVWVLEDDTLVEVDLDVRRGLALHGQVIDPEGRGVADVSVDGWSTESSAQAHAWSDEDGAFALEGLPDEPILVEAGGFGTPWRRHSVRDVRPGGEEVELRLERGAEIRGRVIDGRSGEPSEAVVLLVPLVSEADYGGWTKTFAGSDGGFSMDGLTPGTWDVVALRSDGAVGVTRGVAVRSDAAATETEVVLGEAASLRLVLEGACEFTVYDVFSDGTFVAQGGLGPGSPVDLRVPPGNVIVRASFDESPDREFEITLAAGQAETITIREEE